MAIVPRAPRSRIGREPSAALMLGIPVASTMLGSLSAFLPMVATAPVMPPWGYLVFLGWRLLHRGMWPIWAGLPLGLFDDLFSGQPIGSAMLLWTLTLLAFDLLDRRLVWRDTWQDWGVASGFITLNLLFALGIANLTGGDTAVRVIGPQIAISILLFPMVSRFCSFLDRWRFPS